ncbi:hypothetical protein ACFX1W_006737 [Malus domestica]
MCGFVDVVDPKGRWGLILDERMMNDGAFFKGRRGLILKVDDCWMNAARRTKKAFLILREPGCLRASEFQSFRASEFCLLILVPLK